jgi:hypothetical protein
MTTVGSSWVPRRWRHPRGIHLTAWHDGEIDDPALSAHIESCARCWSVVAVMTKVDAAVRGGPLDPGVASAPSSRLRRQPTLTVGLPFALVAAAIIVLLAPAISVDASKTRFFGRPAGNGTDVSDGSTAAGDAAPASTSIVESNDSRATSPTTQTTGPAPSLATRTPSASAPSDGPSPPAATALRIGLPLPGGGKSNELDAAEMIRGAQAALEAANGAGGIGGRAIELQVLDADSLDATRVDVLVGGLAGRSARTGDRPWFLPADPSVKGSNVVGVLPAPADYGRLLADAWMPPRGTRTFILEDGGEQAPIADAVSAKDPEAVRVSVGDRCEESLSEARRRGASSLALALDRPALEACTAVLRRIGWVPSGQLLAPGYVTFDTPPFPPAADVRALLGVPWPAWDETGPARFRQAAGSLSYRALVTFVAVELAVAVARANEGRITGIAPVVAGAWRSDLLALDGTTNVGLRPARLVSGGWAPVRQ